MNIYIENSLEIDVKYMQYIRDLNNTPLKNSAETVRMGERRRTGRKIAIAVFIDRYLMFCCCFAFLASFVPLLHSLSCCCVI